MEFECYFWIVATSFQKEHSFSTGVILCFFLTFVDRKKIPISSPKAPF